MAHQADTYRQSQRHNTPKLVATELCQVQLNSLRDAERTFNYDNAFTTKPIVALGPKPCFPLCCFHCCLSVPSGYHLIFQKWNANYSLGKDAHGNDIPFKKEGLICCWPWYKRISHIVTQKAVRFNAPVANCPTKDNVLVDIDVSFNFQIFDAQKFVMLMGAGRFQELLRVETEEAIRTLVYTRKILTIRDTTTEDQHTKSIQKALNRSVNAYGVKITQIRIVRVGLPDKLQSELTEQTDLRARMVTMEKEHQRDLEVKLNQNLRENREKERTFERQCEEQRVEVIKEGEIRETRLQMLNATLERSVIEAQTVADARITASQSKLRDAKTRADQTAIEIMNKARIGSEESINKCERQVQKG